MTSAEIGGELRACPACSSGNRSIARYCRQCGAAMPSAPLANLVGLEELKQFLAHVRTATDGAKRQGRNYRIEPTILLMGNQGAGKSILGDEITRELHALGMVTSAEAEEFDAYAADVSSGDALTARFKLGAGRVLFIDNGHCLLDQDGRPGIAHRALSNAIENRLSDAIVVFSGSAPELQRSVEQYAADWSKYAAGQRFRLPDFELDELVEIAARHLVLAGFEVGDEARECIERRLRHLQRERASASSQRFNAYMSLDVAREIESSYYRTGGDDQRILPRHVEGKLASRPAMDDVMASLDDLIGMDTVKSELRGLLESASPLPDGTRKRPDLSHYMLIGNPGTGKTTVARMVGEMLAASGILPVGHVVEVARMDLVGEYLGQTAPKVAAACARARGGVLFIDEAYSLVSSDNDPFGKEAVATLLKIMEDERGKFLVIAAGYPKEMEDFERSNAGLASRFQRLRIEDYDAAELTAIVQRFAAADGFEFAGQALEMLRQQLHDLVSRKGQDFGNARDARNLWDQIRRSKIASGEGSTTIEAADLPDPSRMRRQVLVEAMARLEALVGLRNVKTRIKALKAGIEGDLRRGRHNLAAPHFLFLGNPGTGKTEVARLLGDILFGIGALPSRDLVEAKREDLVAGVVGGTAPKVKAVCEKALGKVLFIDEAYSLKAAGGSNDFGAEATTVLLEYMESHRGKFSVVAAGYDREMDEWMQTNSGLSSRFSERIEFEDYSEDECVDIFELMASRDGMQLRDGVTSAVRESIRAMQGDPHFANARSVRNLYDESLKKCSARVLQMQELDEAEQTRLLHVIEAQDVPARRARP